LLILGRILLADGKDAEAVEPLMRAARMNPLPEYQWTLAEAWLASGMKAAATEIEAQLAKTGPTDDPRTFALFLATRGQQPEVAVALAKRELSERADVHTHDALAWALAAAGRWTEAHIQSEMALAEGTDDARIHLHAGIIAAKVGHVEEAGRQLARAHELQRMLLPSERQHLDKQLTELASLTAETAIVSEQIVP
jgi:Flp pilus assembly protein TadD